MEVSVWCTVQIAMRACAFPIFISFGILRCRISHHQPQPSSRNKVLNSPCALFFVSAIKQALWWMQYPRRWKYSDHLSPNCAVCSTSSSSSSSSNCRRCILFDALLPLNKVYTCFTLRFRSAIVTQIPAGDCPSPEHRPPFYIAPTSHLLLYIFPVFYIQTDILWSCWWCTSGSINGNIFIGFRRTVHQDDVYS